MISSMLHRVGNERGDDNHEIRPAHGRSIRAALFVVAMLGALASAAAACASTGVLVLLPGLEPFTTPEGIVGLPTVDGYRYLVPVDDDAAASERDGVIMIDAGFEPPTAIEREYLQGRRVLAIFITHGHADHALALDAYDGVPIYISADELPFVRGERMWRAPLQQLFRAMLGASRARNAHVVDDGETIHVGGRTFRAIALPGHTAGSTAWLMDDGRDAPGFTASGTLFSGDALMCNGKHGVGLSPAFLSDDKALAEHSLRRLRDHPFRVMLDGHTGRCVDVWSRIPDLLRSGR